MSELFKPVDSGQENAIIAAANQKSKRGANLEERTITNWFTLRHNVTEPCTVERHGENILDTDESGKPYDKKRERITVKIGDLYVCRWCFIGSLDASSE